MENEHKINQCMESAIICNEVTTNFNKAIVTVTEPTGIPVEKNMDIVGYDGRDTLYMCEYL